MIALRKDCFSKEQIRWQALARGAFCMSDASVNSNTWM